MSEEKMREEFEAACPTPWGVVPHPRSGIYEPTYSECVQAAREHHARWEAWLIGAAQSAQRIASLEQQLADVTAELDALKARIEAAEPVAYMEHGINGDYLVYSPSTAHRQTKLYAAPPDTAELIRKAREETKEACASLAEVCDDAESAARFIRAMDTTK